MNEFKGTKGEWKVVYEEEDERYSVKLVERPSFFGVTYIAQEVCQGYDNGLYDAQLIADAGNVRQQITCDLPELLKQRTEMLDFINRISGEMLRNDFVLCEAWYDQARKLIDAANPEKP